MFISAQTLITIAGVLSAVGIIGGVIFKIFKWYLKQNKQDDEISKLRALHIEDLNCVKEENTLICFALLACLDGLQQLGANHSVPVAKEKLEKHLNKQAHK